MTKPLAIFVTGNTNKLAEFNKIVGTDFPYNLINEKIDLPELQGEPEDIAKEKCLHAANYLCKLYPKSELPIGVLIEDTSLCFNALNGLPGPYIKWFLDKTGHEGLNKILHGYTDKSAYAQCIFTFIEDIHQKELKCNIFIGKTDGEIVPAKGPAVFGWDPIFQPNGYQETYAEMPKSIKNKISHRFRAIESLKKFFIQKNTVNQNIDMN